MASDAMIVNIQNLAGTVEKCEVPFGGTLSVLKDCVKAANLVECAPKHMSFSLMPESDNAKPVILDDSHTLASYGISDGDTVHVVTREPDYKRTVVSRKPNDAYYFSRYIKPHGLCMSPDGKYLFVVDTSLKSGVHVFRATDGAYVLQPANAEYRLQTNDGAYVLQPENAAYMLQTDDGKYELQDKDGRFIMKLRYAEGANVLRFVGGFRYPTCACISSDGTTMFVSDAHHHCVKKINISTGETVHTIGRPGNPGRAKVAFDNPRGLCMTHDELFVADQQNHRIQVFNLNGRFRRTFGSFGAGPGQFKFPVGICLSPDNKLFVAEVGNNRIQVFELNGTPIRTFGSEGSGPEQFNSPQYICLSEDGALLFVSDYRNHRVQVLRASDGQYKHTIGKKGVDKGEFTNVFGLCVSNDELFVADGENRNVQVFNIRNMGGGRRKRVRRTQRKRKGKGRKHTKRRRTNRPF